MAALMTLDIAEIQVLVHYPGDPAGLDWHHRVLLHRVDAGDWITLTPDHEFQRHNLSTHAHRILDRRAPFPADIADSVYAHDELTRAQLMTFKRQSQVMAAILGEGAVDEQDTEAWVIADPTHPRFAEVVDSQLLTNAATGMAFSTRGVVLIDNEEIFVERVSLRSLEDWKASKGKELGDVRLLGDHRDSAGRRRLDLSAAVALMHCPEDKEFPIAGTRAAKELHESISEGPGNLLSYHAEWLRLSGVSGRSSSAHIHRHLCEILRLMHSYDQLDASSLASAETVCRWLIQVELAVERSPTSPDYSGLDIVAGTATLPDGRASTNRFNEWVSGRLRERAAIWKQERLYRQEKKLGRGGPRGSADDDSDDDEPNQSKRKKNKKKKGGKEGGKGNDSGAGPSGAGASK